MLDGAPQIGGSRTGAAFFLYVEGPGDRGILRAWSQRLLPRAAHRVFERVVILGGRRPARALEHFAREAGAGPGTRGLCVLDRDDEGAGPPSAPEGLEFFTWTRRHIESYLLVPAALRRALSAGSEEARLERVLRECLPPTADEAAHRELDAKRLLGPRGPLARALGRPPQLARIARATRADEHHPDVHALFDRLRRGLGCAEAPGARSP
jgi:hypothetical protein